jgi:hypothetical protein
MLARTRIYRSFFLLAFLTLGAGAGIRADDATAKLPPVDFSRDIRPILSKNCFACHGPDSGSRVSKLRLDRREFATKPHKKDKTAIVPGRLEESELVRRITASDESDRMPPAESGKRLRSQEIETLKQWIGQGAPYADHWAFVKPVAQPLPSVQHTAWARNPIDCFVLARMEQAGLTQSPEADKFVLFRRASLDLRGLPPTKSEIEEFAADSSANAYERAIDRLLADPRFGERWARMWLDLARYADSAGYGSDPLRPNMWRYRDWVIDAFNGNLPYDQFTLEQIAGDLLPHASIDQKIATAFHRNTMTNTEGGTDREEFRVAAVKDRVDTTLQVWMGLTMGCAKCHSHKYDPITNKEYYQFYAFFNQTADTDQPDESPTMPVPSVTIQAQLDQINGKIAALRGKLNAPTSELEVAQAKWEAELQTDSEWAVLMPLYAESAAGATISKLDDQSLLVLGPNVTKDSYSVTVKTDLQEVTALRLEAVPDQALPAGGSGRSGDGSFWLSHIGISALSGDSRPKTVVGQFVRIEMPGPEKILSLAEVQVFSEEDNIARRGEARQSSTDFEGPANLAIDGNTDGDYFKAKSTTHTRSEANPWWELRLPNPRTINRIVIWNRMDSGLGFRLSNFRVLILDEDRTVMWQTNIADSPNPQRDVAVGGPQQVALSQAFADFTQDGIAVADVISAKSQAKGGWSVSPRQGESHALVIVPANSLVASSSSLLTIKLDHGGKQPGQNLGRFRISATSDPRLLKRAKIPADIVRILDLPDPCRTLEQQETLANHYRSIAPLLQPVRDEISRLEKSRPVLPALPVMVELPAEKRRETTVLVKGNFLNLGEKVEPAMPVALHPFPSDAALNRLGVARWLIDPENPLTARVAVNRLWAQLFGIGLVETEEDFGTQGELPSHPELLDWLALQYVRSGWDTKALLKLMVTSATYRQTSKIAPDQWAKDPRNRLLSRGPRFRLEAETVRDQALALSGLLSQKIGGPSVYPPQPPGLWQAAFNGQRTWATSTGEDRYRRGLYTFWRRTIPYPSMTTFDAPSREICISRRVRTNTPLQAFVTLNDPVYVEIAQALARRIVREGGTSVEDRSRFALQLCLGRPPTDEQLTEIVALFRSELEHYKVTEKAAQELATDPIGPVPSDMKADELAAWTVVANVLLNLDGVLTKG